MKKMKRLFLSLCVLAFGCMLSGCGAAVKTNVKLTSTSKANYTMKVGYDDELLKTLASASDTTKSAIIKELKADGATYTKEKIGGVTYHMFSATEKNISLSKVESYLTESGFSNACVTKNYFYAAYDPDEASSSLSSASLSGLNGIAALQASGDYTESMNFYMHVRITFPSEIKTTNGKLSKTATSASWTLKDASKKITCYASTSKVAKTAKAKSIKNGKTYTAGKKITVKNQSSLAKMTLDGKTIKPNAKVTKKGSHTLIIWSKNGKVQTVTFKIKK